MRIFVVALTIAALLLAVAVPVVLCATFGVDAPVVAPATPRVRVRCAGQAVALRTLVLFRGPPSLA